MMDSRPIHVVACVRISFLFKAEKYCIVCRDHIFIHSFMMDIWVASTFGLLSIMLLWILVHKYLFKTLLWYIPWYIFSQFNIGKNIYVPQAWCNILTTWCIGKVLVEIHRILQSQTFFFFFFLEPHSMRDLSSLTRDWTLHPLHWKCRVLTTGPPGKSSHF